MRSKFGMVLAGVSAVVVLGAAALAETKVEVKKVHLCCGACVKGVATALEGHGRGDRRCDREKGTVTITAPDEATAQKALDALAEAGYHGDVDAKGLTIKAETNVPKGTVKTLSLNNTHNCCKSCAQRDQEGRQFGLGRVGRHRPAEDGRLRGQRRLRRRRGRQALNDAGFHVQVK